MEAFPRYWPFVRGIHRSPVNSPHKGQWRRAMMFSLICAWINDWVNNRETGDLRRHRVHYDVIVMGQWSHNGCLPNTSPWKRVHYSVVYDKTRGTIVWSKSQVWQNLFWNKSCSNHIRPLKSHTSFHLSFQRVTFDFLTHRRRVTHIRVSNWAIFGPNDNLTPIRCQAIIWINVVWGLYIHMPWMKKKTSYGCGRIV